MAEKNYTKMLLVTANVGSIFEDPEHMLKIWLKEFLAVVKSLNPEFLALHCQEVGGKNYEDSMQHVNKFVKVLLSSDELQQFDRVRVFLDEDFTAIDQFTALGCLYFVHQSVGDVQIWNFEASSFEPVLRREVHSGNIDSVPIKEKAKFPQEFFPDFKWSRKGFIRTRWRICDSVFDLINIHLFHDASNIVAMETSPSAYTKNRRRVLQHTIERFESDQYNTVPFFMFGDFNFRLDTQSLIEKLTTRTTPQHVRGKKNELSKIIYTDEGNQVVLTVQKKGFDYHDQHSELFGNNRTWLREFDIESHAFTDKVSEYEITFPPSYPFSEDTNDGMSYMKTRCPSWCDRIMFSHSATNLIAKTYTPVYNVIGPQVCMGDHKPVYLDMRLQHARQGKETSSMQRMKLSKSLSVNGELVSPAKLNIHDFATFLREQHLSEKFKNSIQRRASSPNIDSSDISSALRRYRFRSESEPDSDTEVDPSESHKTLTEITVVTGADGDTPRVNSENNNTKNDREGGEVSVAMVTIHESVGVATGESVRNGGVSPLTHEPHPPHGMSTGVSPSGNTEPQQQKSAQRSGLCGLCCIVQ